MSRLSLAQQLAQLEDATPVDFDPEDAFRVEGFQQPDDETNEGGADATANGREHYFEVGRSTLKTRAQLDSISHPKYTGIKSSRDAIYDDHDDQSEDHDMEDEDDKTEPQEPSIAEESIDKTRESAESSRSSEEDSESGNEDEDEVEDNQLATALRKTREQDRIKGKAIARQLAIWDSLLDTRIKLQKAVVGCNRLPPPDKIAPYVSSSLEAGQEAARRLLEESLKLSDDLFELQQTLLAASAVKIPPPKKRKITGDHDEEDYERQVRMASTELSALESASHSDLVQTLEKWSAKVAAVTSTSTSSTKFKAQPSAKSAVQLIAESTTSGTKLLARTRVRRGGGASTSRIGEEGREGGGDDPEVFDDVDFYQQLLRDVIDSRSSKEGLAAGESEAWSTRRQAQRKHSGSKFGDSKASKGRRLKYDVHEKLQNFMVPVTSARKWHEEQIDELFASLLGKGFEGAAEEAGASDRTRVEEGSRMDVVGLVGDDLGGLRVF